MKRALGGRGEQYLVAAPEVESEGLGALDKSRNVCIAAQQIVEELAACGLLLSNHLPPGGLMALDQGPHGVVDHPQDSLRGGTNLVSVARLHYHRDVLPQPPGRRKIQVDRLISVDTLLGRESTKSPNCGKLALLGTPARKGRVG
jgi:hypothetical protein